MTAAKKLAQPAAADPADQEEELTSERRLTVRACAPQAPGRATTRMSKIDAHLLAMARGEIEPEDPFGGLIPIYENDESEIDESEKIECEDNCLSLPTAPGVEGMFGATVPSLRMRPDQIFELPLEARSVLFLWQIDGQRTVEAVAAVCGINDLAALEIIDELLRHGVIDLV